MKIDESDQAKRKAATTYDAAADSFEEPALSFWDLMGGRTDLRQLH
jgi:hypothetical protein